MLKLSINCSIFRNVAMCSIMYFNINCSNVKNKIHNKPPTCDDQPACLSPHHGSLDKCKSKQHCLYYPESLPQLPPAAEQKTVNSTKLSLLSTFFTGRQWLQQQQMISNSILMALLCLLLLFLALLGTSFQFSYLSGKDPS